MRKAGENPVIGVEKKIIAAIDRILGMGYHVGHPNER
jgi:hypothetical protein